MLADWLGSLWATLGGRAQVRALNLRPTSLHIRPDDTLIGYLERHPPAALAVDGLDGPAARELEQQGVRLIVPLLAQGRLVGLLGLGEPATDRVYSADDLLFLTALANAAAPAVRIGQLLAREQSRARRDGQPRAAAGLGRP